MGRISWSERCACHLADQILCVSRSARNVAVAEKLCRAATIKVLVHGSVNGVDAENAFNPTRVSVSVGQRMRKPGGPPLRVVVVVQETAK